MDYFGSYGPAEAEALRILEPVLDRALEAHQTGDYNTFLELVTPAFASAVPEAGFARAHREVAPTLGELLDKRFLGAFRRSDDPVLIYVARYDATDSDVLIRAQFKNGLSHPKIDWMHIE